MLWNPDAWTAGESTAAQRTPNSPPSCRKSSRVPGWASGNAIVFLISGTGHRTADAFDETGGSPPRLAITFTSSTPLHTMTASINSGANDAEQSAAGVVTLTSTDLELVNDDDTGAGNQIVGLRFENVALPAAPSSPGPRCNFRPTKRKAGPQRSLCARKQRTTPRLSPPRPII